MESVRVFGLFYFNMQYIKRRQTVAYAPGYWKSKPMIRLINRFLLDSGFQIGNKVEVKYEDGRIVITRLPVQE